MRLTADDLERLAYELGELSRVFHDIAGWIGPGQAIGYPSWSNTARLAGVVLELAADHGEPG